MPALRHLHTYEKSRVNKDIYKCAHPKCSHFVNIRQVDLHGKSARCKCGQEFIINAKDPDRHLRKAEMKCPNCSHSSRGKTLAVASEVIDHILGGIPSEIEVVLNKPKEAPAQLDLMPAASENQGSFLDDDMSGFPVDSEENENEEKKGAA